MMSHSEDVSVDRFEKILEGTSVGLLVCAAKPDYVTFFCYIEI